MAAFDPGLGYVPGGSGYAPLSTYYGNFDPNSGMQNPTGGVGANPYAFARYGYQGPGYNPYGMPIDLMYGGYEPYYGSAIDKMAQNNRDLSLAGGLSLGRDLYNYGGYEYGRSADYEDRLRSAYEDIAQGRGGYSDAEKAAILNNPYLQSLQLSPEQMQSNYLTGEEQSGIMGDPMAAFRYASGQGGGLNDLYVSFANQVGAGLGGQEQSIHDALISGGNQMRGSIYDAQGKQYQNLSDIAGLTRFNVGQTGSNVRSYIDPNALTLSPEYQATYQVNPQDMQGIMNEAGRSVGAQAASDEERLLQQANAAGNVNPMALQAARNRIRLNSTVAGADAMSDAAIRAKQLQLQTEQQRENTRLGAEQRYAGLGTESEFGLGQQGLQNEQYMGSNTLGTQANLTAAQLGAEQFLANQNVGAQQYLGSSRLANLQSLLGSGLQEQEFTAGLGTGVLQGGEQQQAQRAGTLAGSRLSSNQYNQGQQFGRGQFIYGAGSQANQLFGNQRLGQEQEFRNWMANQQNQAGQNATVANQQRLGLYGQMNTGMQGATEGAIRNYSIPGFGSQLFGQIWGPAVGAASKAVAPHALGGVTKGPHAALVGEAGPELIVDLAADGDMADPNYGLNLDPMYQAQAARTQPIRPPQNPLYTKIMQGVVNPIGTATDALSKPAGGSDGGFLGDIGNALGPSLLGAGLGALGRWLNRPKAPEEPTQPVPPPPPGSGPSADEAYASGGVATPHHYFGNRKKLHNVLGAASKVELVTHPQIRTLGSKVPQAVVPLQKRKSNKVDLSDIPALLKKYSPKPKLQ